MAVDKLVDSTQLDSDLTSVANAIRTKGGTSASLAFPADFVSAIAAIPTGGGGDAIIRQIVALGTNGLRYASIGETAFFESLTNLGEHCLANLPETKILVFPATTGSSRYPYSDNALLEKVDVGPSFNSTFLAWYFSEDKKLTEIILRMSSVKTLENINCFNLTPFASNGTGGTLYVPQSLISTYQSASNWSTILGYAHNSIVAIEGSYYETHYADGTVIS